MKYLILVVDDEREIIDNILADLKNFQSHFDIEAAESADEARERLLTTMRRRGSPWH